MTSADPLIALNHLTVGPSALQLIAVPGPASGASVTAAKSFSGSDTLLEIIALSIRADGSVRVQLRYQTEDAPRILHAAQIGLALWQPVPADWMTLLDEKICEIRIPRDQAGKQHFFRCDSSSKAE